MTPAFRIWCRARGGRWKPVAEAADYAQAVRLIGVGNRGSADWLILEGDRDAYDPPAVPAGVPKSVGGGVR